MFSVSFFFSSPRNTARWRELYEIEKKERAREREREERGPKSAEFETISCYAPISAAAAAAGASHDWTV